MTGIKPHTAMVLAAGRGERMRPLSDHTPKPLLSVAGQSMLRHTLDALRDFGVKRAVVNVHYLAEQVRAHLADYEGLDIVFSPEPELLETGGGTKLALPLLGAEPFFIVNADSVWRDAPGTSSLASLCRAWRPEQMDVLLMLSDTRTAFGFNPELGDYFIEGSFNAARAARLLRAGTKTPRPFVYNSLQLVSPKIYANAPAGRFSNLLLWDALEQQGRLWGWQHEGQVYHVGTPEALAEVNRLLSA